MNILKILASPVITILLIFIHGFICGQQTYSNFSFDTSTTYKIKLSDDNEFTGKFTKKDSITIVIKTKALAIVEIPIDKIRSVEIIEENNIRLEKYWFPNPYDTKYFLGPSAINLRKGEIYYQLTYMIINSIDYGLNRNISIGGGFDFLSAFSAITGGESPTLFIKSKACFKVTEKMHLGASVGLISAPMLFKYPKGDNLVGIAYALGTYGSSDNNITIGIGGDFAYKIYSKIPLITIGATVRTGRKISLVTENWLMPYWKYSSDNPIQQGSINYYGFYSYGARYFGEKISVELALVDNKDFSRIFILGIPYIDFVIKF